MSRRKAHKVEDRERTDDIQIEENVDFSSMYLSERVLKGLSSAGFERPSPIQLAAIPLGRCGLDLVVQAKSGTGKTCVFAVIALEMVSASASTTQVLVVAPTREIAVQITQVMGAIGSGMPELRLGTFIGGLPLGQDKAKLSCCHIAVGTPGRITQLVELGHLKLDNVRLFVLDEADQLLSGQFTKGVYKLASALPLSKQILALSATYTEEVAKVAEGLMRSPNHVRLGRDSPALLGVNQFVRLLPYHHQPHRVQKTKFEELLAILAQVTFNQCLVFSNSQLRAESICNALRANGWPVSYLTGGQNQSDRLQALDELCSYKCRVLVSTDLSARGLDSEHVNLVINLDMPYNHATYLHRVGRAGRFGSRGCAITLVTEGDEWQSMRAVVTLANVQVFLLQEACEASMASKEVKNMEEVEKLTDEDAKVWLQNNSSKTFSKKSNGKAKKVSDQRNKSSETVNSSGNELLHRKKAEASDDSGKDNRDDNIVLKKKSHKKKEGSEQKKEFKHSGNENARNKKAVKLKDCNDLKKKNEKEKIQHQAEQYKKILNMLQGLNINPATVDVSYPDLLRHCSEKYDSVSAGDNPLVSVPPYPVGLTPSQADMKVIDDHWIGVQEKLMQRTNNIDQSWRDHECVVHEALQAMIEGRDPVTVLHKMDERQTICNVEDQYTAPSTQTHQSDLSEQFYDDPTNSREFVAYTQDTITTGGSVKQKTKKHAQKSKATPTLLSGESTDDHPKMNKKKNKFSSKDNTMTPRPCAKEGNEDQGEADEEYCLSKRKLNKSKKHKKTIVQGDDDYLNEYFDQDFHLQNWEFTSQHPSAAHYSTWPRQHHYNADYNWQEEDGYYETGQNDPQADTYGNYNEGEIGWSGEHHKENRPSNHGQYWYDWDPYYASAYWNHRSYVDSAYKFASMMDYVQTMGRMSAWVAQDFHTRNKTNY